MSHFIDQQWLPGTGDELTSTNPANGEAVWSGRAATADEIDRAVIAARSALPGWSAFPLEKRISFLEAFAGELRRREVDLAETISREVGKPLWESREELASMVGKVAASIQAYAERQTETNSLSSGITASTRFKPHGVLAVFGPFNFPGHLPNGHIVPALLAGNTIVFKPSEMTPLVARKTVEAWEAAALPPGVLNLVQGGRKSGIALAAHRGLDGILFTGSVLAGQALLRANAAHPNRILALEMGGNNPLIVSDVGDLNAAAHLTILSAFLTSGQRCTCARRLIVPVGREGDRFIERLAEKMCTLRVGPYWQDPPTFMGPVISDHAAERLLAAQDNLRFRGGQIIVPMSSIGPRKAMLSPGLMDITKVRDMEDQEHFGPFLQLIRVEDFDAALREANRTAYGLAAGLLSDRRDLYERFYRDIRAGVVNWNRPTTGASGKLPFGGIGLSGNHRPSGYFAADYCSYPVASLEMEKITLPPPTPGIP